MSLEHRRCPHPGRGANRGADAGVSGRRWLALASHNSLKNQRPASVDAGPRLLISRASNEP